MVCALPSRRRPLQTYWVARVSLRTRSTGKGVSPLGGKRLLLIGSQRVGPDHAQGNVAVGEQGADAVFSVFERPGHGGPVRGD